LPNSLDSDTIIGMVNRNDTQDRLRCAKDLLKARLLALLPESGSFATDIPGLQLSRRDTSGQKENCFYRPMLALVVQGFKRSVIGDEEYHCREGSCAVIAVDMPSMVHIMEASRENPFLSMSITLDRGIITQLATESPLIPLTDGDSLKSVTVAEITQELLDSFLRLVDLLDKPRQMPVLAPMIVREIHYRLLCGPQGEGLRLFCAIGSPYAQIAQAISWLKENYREPLRIVTLAERVNMAESTFNRHFRKITNLSPLQFQKRLRLYEAQRLMLAEGKSAETVAFAVGYDSATQFNREYKRLFGEPPHRDINRMAATGAVVGCKMKYL
jgi:AraC-like DNA-binding protein